MADLINRDKVIEAIDDISIEVDEGYGFQYEKWRKYFCELPGAQELNLINVYGLEEEIRCAMCENPMCTDRGCDGGCEYDERLYDTIIKVLNGRIKKLQFLKPRKGKWIMGKSWWTKGWECSLCGKHSVDYTEYCPHCGERMEEYGSRKSYIRSDSDDN